MEYYKTRMGNKEKDKVALAVCGLQTSTRNRSIISIEMEHLLIVCIESRIFIKTKALKLFKRFQSSWNQLPHFTYKYNFK